MSISIEVWISAFSMIYYSIHSGHFHKTNINKNFRKSSTIWSYIFDPAIKISLDHFKIQSPLCALHFCVLKCYRFSFVFFSTIFLSLPLPQIIFNFLNSSISMSQTMKSNAQSCKYSKKILKHFENTNTPHTNRQSKIDRSNRCDCTISVQNTLFCAGVQLHKTSKIPLFLCKFCVNPFRMTADSSLIANKDRSAFDVVWSKRLIKRNQHKLSDCTREPLRF